MPTVRQRKLSLGEQSELKRLQQWTKDRESKRSPGFKQRTDWRGTVVVAPSKSQMYSSWSPEND